MIRNPKEKPYVLQNIGVASVCIIGLIFVMHLSGFGVDFVIGLADGIGGGAGEATTGAGNQ